MIFFDLIQKASQVVTAHVHASVYVVLLFIFWGKVESSSPLNPPLFPCHLKTDK